MATFLIRSAARLVPFAPSQKLAQNGPAEFAGFGYIPDPFGGTACALCASQEPAQNGHAEAAGFGHVPDPFGGTVCALCASDLVGGGGKIELHTEGVHQGLGGGLILDVCLLITHIGIDQGALGGGQAALGV